MKTIYILWIREERSSSFNGTRIGYKTDDGSCGSFSVRLLETYKSIFNIVDVKNILI